MLPAAHRLADAPSFRDASRRGRRAAARTLVVHVLAGDVGVSGDPAPARVGFVVSKAVGGAVVRTRVKRRLRHAVRPYLTALPRGAVLVVRALPPAASASFPVLARDLASALDRAGAVRVGVAP